MIVRRCGEKPVWLCFCVSLVTAVVQVVPAESQGPVDTAAEVFKGETLIPGGESNPYPEDTVVWPEYTDDGLIPPPKEARRPGFPEAPGESIGQTGPVIIQGRSRRKIMIGIFAPDGRAVGFFGREEARKRPDDIITAINIAHDVGRKQFLRTGPKRLGVAIPAGWRKPPEEGPWWTPAIPSQQPRDTALQVPEGWTSPRQPKDWTPEAAVILRQGIPPKERAFIRDLIVVVLVKNKRGDAFLKIFRDSIYVYIGEKIFIRRIQTDPDDPLYAKGGGGTSGSSARKKGGFGIGFGIGGAIGGGFGGVTIGAGGKKSGPHIVDQWGLHRVGFTPKGSGRSAWDVLDGRRKNVTVAVIDSGLDMDHPDGPAFVWTNEGEIPGNGIDDDGNGYIDDVHGYDFVEGDADLEDINGHGTFIAGIIAAASNNGKGIAGINPGAVIMPVKVVNDRGVSSSLDVWRGIHYAVDNGARIINLSLGEKGLSRLEQLAVNYAVSSGVPVVVASGNAGETMSDYGPAGVRRAFVVGAIDFDGKVSVISNRGPNLALVAPGEEIYSLHSQKAEWEGPAMDRERLYTKKSGTSFAAPFATGTMSLLLALHPDLTPDDLENILLGTTKDIPPAGWDGDSGAGLLDAAAALRADPNDPFLWVRPVEVRIVREKKRPQRLVLTAKASPTAERYTLKIGKGERPKKWTAVVTESPVPSPYGVWAVVDDKTVLRWRTVTWRLTVTDETGRQEQAVWSTRLK